MTELVGAIPLTALDAIPILPAYVACMARLLEGHGATLTKTGSVPPKNVDPAAEMYTITFPPGTMRVDGLVIHRSVPFVISFPDGYRLQGARLFPITLQENDPYIHGLFPAKTDIQF